MKRTNLLTAAVFATVVPVLILFAVWGFGSQISADEGAVCGDVNDDEAINVLDITHLINYLYKAGAPPVNMAMADVNSSGDINLLDVTWLINFLYKSGPAPDCPSGSAGAIVGSTGCKTFGNPGRDTTLSSYDCLAWEYDGQGGLFLRHINAGFNCCPVIHADITIEGNVISIVEYETFDSLGPCYCLCLFDIDYEFTEIFPMEYTVIVKGLYVEPDEDFLEITVDFGSEPEGVYCIERDHYPWGFGEPSGGLINHSGCGGFDDGSKPVDTLEEDCVSYEYDGESELILRHHNALFNCCPDYLYAVVSVVGNTIDIVEYESTDISGGCDCICVFDLDYFLVFISPGIYTIRIDNPQYYICPAACDPIEFEVDLTGPTSGAYCVDRPYLPWEGIM